LPFFDFGGAPAAEPAADAGAAPGAGAEETGVLVGALKELAGGRGTSLDPARAPGASATPPPTAGEFGVGGTRAWDPGGGGGGAAHCGGGGWCAPEGGGRGGGTPG